jgi:hypothetical protein
LRFQGLKSSKKPLASQGRRLKAGVAKDLGGVYPDRARDVARYTPVRGPSARAAPRPRTLARARFRLMVRPVTVSVTRERDPHAYASVRPADSASYSISSSSGSSHLYTTTLNASRAPRGPAPPRTHSIATGTHRHAHAPTSMVSFHLSKSPDAGVSGVDPALSSLCSAGTKVALAKFTMPHSDLQEHLVK